MSLPIKKYFRLNSSCCLVNGVNGGCIYNLVTGNMMLFKGDEYNAIKKCEENIPLSDISNLNIEFIEKLYNLNLGMYYDEQVYVEKLSVGMPKLLSYLEDNFFHINSLFIELTNKCNFDCVFCPKNDNTLYRTTGCKRWKIKNSNKDISFWKNVVSQISKLSCQQLVFMGGEPFLSIELLHEIIVYAKSCNINKFLIFTNGSILNQNIIEFIKKYDIKLQIQLLANTNKSYKKITGCEGVYNVIYKNLSLLRSNEVDYNLTLLVSSLNEEEVEAIIRHYSRFLSNKKSIKCDFIYPVLQNKFSSKKYINSIYDKKKTLRKIKVNDFCYANKYHNCYGNGLAISADGDLFPCIMSRGLLLGNVNDNKIIHILRDSKYNYYRKLTKDKIEGCESCSFRYGCFDCRAIEMYSTDKIKGMRYCNVIPLLTNAQ